MTSITLNVTGAMIRAAVNGPLTSGMVGIPVTIHYDDTWNGLTKNLVCRCGKWGPDKGETRTILSVGETATVAHEVMKADMHLYLGIEGYSADGKLVMPTTWADCGRIQHGANAGADPSANPKLSIWAQLQSEIEQIKQNPVTEGAIAAAVAAYLKENPIIIPGSGQNGNGLSETARNLLITILRNAAYVADQSANITALKAALGGSEDGSGGEDTHTHSYTSSVTAAATCTTAGVRTYTCSCGSSYTESIPATGHNYVDGICSVCGAVESGGSGEDSGDSDNTNLLNFNGETIVTDGTGTATILDDHSIVVSGGYATVIINGLTPGAQYSLDYENGAAFSVYGSYTDNITEEPPTNGIKQIKQNGYLPEEQIPYVFTLPDTCYALLIFPYTGTWSDMVLTKEADPSDAGGDETEVTLSGISAIYSGGDVAVGTGVADLTGIVVTAAYSDGSTATVTDYTLSGTIAEGSNTVTVSYGGKTATFTVTGVAESGGEEAEGNGWTNGVPYALNLVENEYPDKATGAIKTYSNWARTDYLPCYGVSVLRFSEFSSVVANGSNDNVFYDENKNYVGKFTMDDEGCNIVVPSGAYYFIASHQQAVMNVLTITPIASEV